MVVREEYAEGNLHGLTTCSYPHSELVERTYIYHHGALREKAFYSRAGMPLCRMDFDENGSSSVAMWYENGTAKCRERYDSQHHLLEGEYFTPDHQPESNVASGQGVRPVRDDYGQLLWKEKIANGEVVEKTSYHPNGMPKEIAEWSQGAPHGQTRRFLPSGEPSSVETWSQGRRDGLTTEYQNGEKYAEISYYLDRKHGMEKRYRDNKLVEEISWKDDVRHGPSCVYYNGNKLFEWYHKGMPVTKSAYLELNQNGS